MPLKEFILSTLYEITDAAIEFGTDFRHRERGHTTVVPSIGVSSFRTIQPKSLIELDIYPQDPDRYESEVSYATMVDFDIAVTAAEQDTDDLGGGIRVMSMLNADGGVDKQSANFAVSRVRFSLPLKMR